MPDMIEIRVARLSRTLVRPPLKTGDREPATERQLTTGSEYEKGIRWMPWHQEAMKDVARCEKPRGAASRL